MLSAGQQATLLVFLVATMAGMGLQVSLRELQATVSRKSLLVRSLLLNFLLIPLLGWLIVRIIPMASPSADAIVILACAPGGCSAIQFTSKRKDVLAFAGLLTLLLAFTSLFVTPLLLRLFLPDKVDLITPYVGAFWFLVAFLLVPMLAGLLLRARAMQFAGQIAGPVAITGTLAFFAFVLLTLSSRQAAMATLTRADLLAMVGFVLLTMLLGWVAGGRGREDREVLASASGMRNAALALVMATRSFSDGATADALVAFSALMIPPNVILLAAGVICRRFRNKSKAMGSSVAKKNSANHI